MKQRKIIKRRKMLKSNYKLIVQVMATILVGKNNKQNDYLTNKKLKISHLVPY